MSNLHQGVPTKLHWQLFLIFYSTRLILSIYLSFHPSCPGHWSYCLSCQTCSIYESVLSNVYFLNGVPPSWMGHCFILLYLLCILCASLLPGLYQLLTPAQPSLPFFLRGSPWSLCTSRNTRRHVFLQATVGFFSRRYWRVICFAGFGRMFERCGAFLVPLKEDQKKGPHFELYYLSPPSIFKTWRWGSNAFLCVRTSGLTLTTN